MDDKYKAQKKYAKSHIKKLGCSYPAEFVDAFKDACKTLGVKQSEVIREAMNKIIEQAIEQTRNNVNIGINYYFCASHCTVRTGLVYGATFI